MTKKELIEAMAHLDDDTEVVIFEHRDPVGFSTAETGWETSDEMLYGDAELMAAGYTREECKRVFMLFPD